MVAEVTLGTRTPDTGQKCRGASRSWFITFPCRPVLVPEGMVLSAPSPASFNIRRKILHNILTPFINLANANFVALSRFLLAPADPGHYGGNELWRAVMINQAGFVHEYSAEMLELLNQSRELMVGNMEKLSQRTETVAAELAHSTVRAVAIATQARREKRDRRVFPLPLPGSRRITEDPDRRLSLPN